MTKKSPKKCTKINPAFPVQERDGLPLRGVRPSPHVVHLPAVECARRLDLGHHVIQGPLTSPQDDAPSPCHVRQQEGVEAVLGDHGGHLAGFIFVRLARDPHFDNVTRRHGYSRGPSRFCKWQRGSVIFYRFVLEEKGPFGFLGGRPQPLKNPPKKLMTIFRENKPLN